MMNHPNVARVFDAGATPLGRPYFVMELVGGERIVALYEAWGRPEKAARWKDGVVSFP